MLKEEPSISKKKLKGYADFLQDIIIPLLTDGRSGQEAELAEIAPLFLNTPYLVNEEVFTEFLKILFNSEEEFNENEFREKIKATYVQNPKETLEKYMERNECMIYTQLNLMGEAFNFLGKNYRKKLDFLLNKSRELSGTAYIIEDPGLTRPNLKQLLISTEDGTDSLKRMRILETAIGKGKSRKLLFKYESELFNEENLKKQIVSFLGITESNYERIREETGGFIVSYMPIVMGTHATCIAIDLSKSTYAEFLEELIKTDTKSIISFDLGHYGYLKGRFSTLTKTLYSNRVVPMMQSSSTCGYHTMAAMKVLARRKDFSEIRSILSSEEAKKQFQYEYNLELIKIMAERLDSIGLNFKGITELEEKRTAEFGSTELDEIKLEIESIAQELKTAEGAQKSKLETKKPELELAVTLADFEGLSKGHDIYAEVGFKRPEGGIADRIRNNSIAKILPDIISEIEKMTSELKKIEASKELLEAIVETRIKQAQLFSFSAATAEKYKKRVSETYSESKIGECEVGSAIDGEFVNRLREQEKGRLQQLDTGKVLKFE